MSWSRFNNDNKNDSSDFFKYYKIIRSTTNVDPVYPEDWAIKYYDNIDSLKYTDNYPKTGISYYRVCTITKSEIRHCSNVVKLNIEKENQWTICTYEYEPVCWYVNGQYKTFSNKCNLLNDKAYYKYSWKCKTIIDNNKNTFWLSNSLQIKSKGIINRFIKNIESRWFSNEKKLEVIDSIIDKLIVLWEDKPKLNNILKYLIDLLKEKKDKYENDFSEIEDIFNIN